MPVPTAFAVRVPIEIEPVGAESVTMPALEMPKMSPDAETLENPEATMEVMSRSEALEVSEIVPALAWLSPLTLTVPTMVAAEDKVVIEPALLFKPVAMAEMLPRLLPSESVMALPEEVIEIVPPEAPLASI